MVGLFDLPYNIHVYRMGICNLSYQQETSRKRANGVRKERDEITDVHRFDS